MQKGVKMMKKRWYRGRWAKGLWLVLGIVSVEAAAVSAGAAVGIRSMGIQPFDSEVYVDSRSFTEDLYTNTLTLLNALDQQDFLGDGSGVIDLKEVADGSPLTYRNTSGLAYSAEDLKNWVQEDWLGGDTENVLICKKENGEEEYLYYDEFEEKIEDGELKFQFSVDSGAEYGYDPEENAYDGEQELLDWLRTRSFTYGTGINDSFYGATVTDKEGELLYTDVYNFADYAIPEKYAPEGEDSILEVLNENPRWQGKIQEAYAALSQTLNDAAAAVESKDTLEQMFAPGKTNFNYVFADKDKDKVYTNVEELKDPSDYKAVSKLAEKGGNRYVVLSPEEGGINLRETISANLDKWKHLADNYSTDYTFAVWTDRELDIPDFLSENRNKYETYSKWMTPSLASCGAALVLLAVSLGFLTAGAGRNNKDEEIHLNFFDRWFTEIAAVLVAGIWIAGLTGILNFASWNLELSEDVGYVLLFNVLGLWTALWFFIGWMSLVRRIKAKTLWSSSFTRWFLMFVKKILQKGWELMKDVAELFAVNTSSRVKMTLIFGGFCFFQFVVCAMIFGANAVILLIPLLAADAAGLIYLLRKARGREEILKGLKKITDGDLQYKIPLEKMTGEQKTIAEYINRIGDGLDSAVENSLKNERMKTELITNVSHDIKTPLTSIINYIDLLKRENPTDPKICGYLDILEEKAQRLKHLTEDVVEASKASTGNISLEMADLNFVELVHQVIGEFEEKFQEKNLTLMVHFEEDEAIICADGRRMWRVLENVFGNVSKYAMENTRVYAEIKVKKPKVIFSLKNISAQPLNISADELTERFIRGDVSRNTEGSGLGLSIAKSLTELQGGEFRLYLDGDLFKVTIVFQVEEK